MSRTAEGGTQAPAARRGRTGLFVFAAVALGLFAAGIAMVSLSLPLLQKRRVMTQLMHERGKDMTYGRLAGELTAAQREHVEACYFEGGALDLDTLFWSPRNRPTPFIGYAPQNGVQFGRHFNFQQLNMAGELPLPKPAGEYRVFLTGASVALGGGAPTDESTIAGVMQKNLAPEYAARGRQARIVCGAACGWSSTQERLLIENRLSEWEPDAVIQLTGFNDMHWGFNKFSTLDGRSYDDHNFLLLINGGLALAGEPEYSDVPPIRPEVPVDPDLIAQRFVKNIRLAAQALALRNTPLIVGLQPILAPEFKPLSPGEQALYAQAGEPLQAHVEACYQRFRARLFGADGALLPELAQAHPNLRVIDLRGLYAQRPEPYFLDLVHQGTRGNVVIAEALGAELMKLATSTLPLEQAP